MSGRRWALYHNLKSRQPGRRAISLLNFIVTSAPQGLTPQWWMCSAAAVVGGGVLHIRTPPRNSPWAFSITVRPERHTVMLCCFKAVTLTQGGQMWFGAVLTPKLLSHGMETRRGDAEQPSVSLFVLQSWEYKSGRVKGSLGFLWRWSATEEVVYH